MGHTIGQDVVENMRGGGGGGNSSRIELSMVYAYEVSVGKPKPKSMQKRILSTNKNMNESSMPFQVCRFTLHLTQDNVPSADTPRTQKDGIRENFNAIWYSAEQQQQQQRSCAFSSCPCGAMRRLYFEYSCRRR